MTTQFHLMSRKAQEIVLEGLRATYMDDGMDLHYHITKAWIKAFNPPTDVHKMDLGQMVQAALAALRGSQRTYEEIAVFCGVTFKTEPISQEVRLRFTEHELQLMREACASTLARVTAVVEPHDPD